MASITLNQTKVQSNWNTTSQIHMAKRREKNAAQAKDGPIS